MLYVNSKNLILFMAILPYFKKIPHFHLRSGDGVKLKREKIILERRHHIQKQAGRHYTRRTQQNLQ